MLSENDYDCLKNAGFSYKVLLVDRPRLWHVLKASNPRGKPLMLKNLIKNNAFLVSNYRILVKNKTPLFFEYEYDYKRRWPHEAPNRFLQDILSAQNNTYTENLNEMAAMGDLFKSIERKGPDPLKPRWVNGFMPALDGMSLCWATQKCHRQFVEIGSGNSTLFVHAAKTFLKKQIEITSIDPMPRRGIDGLCDHLYRQPLEDLDLKLFEKLEAGDVVFVDNSHRSFMNSDVTVFMLDVLPRLKPGVMVGIHDVFLPYDYPAEWSHRLYNEQYLLASMLLANPDYFDIQLATYWMSVQKMHIAPLQEVWNAIGPDLADRYSGSFWGIKR
jgi:hypothetical protein